MIPPELIKGRWIRCYGKGAIQKYKTDEDKAAHMKTYEEALAKKRPTENIARLIEKADGYVFLDLDHVRVPGIDAVEPWAEEIISALDTYTEISQSGTGFHLVARGTLPEDYVKEGVRVELKSGNVRNRLFTLTGEIYGSRDTVQSRQTQLTDLLRKCKAGEFKAPADPPPPKADHGAVIEAACHDALVNPEGEQAKILREALAAAPETSTEPKRWREVFHTGSELGTVPTRVYIKGILEEGITFFGALSGVGKTWVGLSIARALITGEPLFGVFPVLQKTNVLYLVPEESGSRFRDRMMKLRLPMDGCFYCQTVKDGACDLEDPILMEAITAMKPMVILDTAIRFQAGDENSSTEQAQGLGAKMFKLITGGAAGVIAMHHRKKDLGDSTPTLENTLRGTTDFGAAAQCVWCVEHARKRNKNSINDNAYVEESKTLTRLTLTNVKPRDMEPADPFTIQGRPYIDQGGDFAVLTTDREVEPMVESKHEDEKLIELITAEPEIGQQAILQRIHFGIPRQNRIFKEKGYKKISGKWVQGEQPQLEI